MYKIEVRVRFRYGHRLMPPYKGKCNNPHGEGGTAIFVFKTKLLDSNGMVDDFGNAKRTIKEWIDKHLDHAYIYRKDDKVGKFLKKSGFKVYEMEVNPTAENIACLLCKEIREHGKFGRLTAVGIIESFEDSIAWYEMEY